MSLRDYEEALANLRPNSQGGHNSPHKACLLLAVFDLVATEKLTLNRIYFNDELRDAFSARFNELAGQEDRNSPFLPFFHLRSSGFWHHRVFSNKQDLYDVLDTASASVISECIEYSYLDDELFEWIKSSVIREYLTAAILQNLDDQVRSRLLNGGVGWSWLECEATAESYFKMLGEELAGRRYNKAEHRRALAMLLKQRSEGAIEMKHQNITAVLMELGYPTISGYKPAGNYQRILKSVVEAKIFGAKSLTDLIAEDIEREAAAPQVDDMTAMLVDCPELSDTTTSVPQVRERRQPYKVNYLEREAKNRSLGFSGEELVLRYEKERLISVGQERLAEQVDHIAKIDDGAGYDILSFESSGKDRLIEVKTTRYGKYTPFYITQNELVTSQRRPEDYYLYRLFNFSKDPGLFLINGDLNDSINLFPVSYRASF